MALGRLLVGLSLLPATALAQPAPPTAPAASPDATRADPGKPKPAPTPAAQPAPAQPATTATQSAGAQAGAAAAAAPTTPAQPAPAQPAPAATPAPAEAPLIPDTRPAAPRVSPSPAADTKALLEQGKPSERPLPKGDVGAKPSEVYADDWWSHARPTFEFHGYYRVRAELLHNFALGRIDEAGKQLWPQPPDNDYTDAAGIRHQIDLCGDDPTVRERCENNTQAGANMRFRINPELHISDNLRIMSQIDLLDNVVLGSTPDGYGNQPGNGGYEVVARGGYAPTSAFSTTQWAPSSGQNSNNDSIQVKRVWAEYLTPIGQLRFGRMPSHWGLGMIANSGDGHDSDWQSTADRLMFVTGIKKLDLYFGAAWDFANEGATSVALNERQGQAYDLAQSDDVDQYVLVAVRRRNPELQKLDLAKGLPVFNGGVYFVYRNQLLADDESGAGNAAYLGQSSSNITKGFVRRGAEAVIPDLWFQFLYEKFRFEMEAAMIYGSLENTNRTGGPGTDYNNPADANDPGWKIRQFGMATQTEYRAMEDKLRVGFGFGYASGDDDVDSLAPQDAGLQPQRTADRTFSTFRFHPDYRVDLILFRNILSRIQGAYYFRPNVEYDFSRDKNGQRLGGGAALIWSRASEFVQTPGHARDLGVELNFKLYFQAKDGTLNDDPDKMGGFFTSLEYGVMFPLGAFDYLEGQQQTFTDNGLGTIDTATAQTVRWYLGVLF
jgi:uncharacterized protein (TIGR04551 family)